MMKHNSNTSSRGIHAMIIAATAVASLGLATTSSYAQTATPGATTTPGSTTVASTATPSPASTSASTATVSPSASPSMSSAMSTTAEVTDMPTGTSASDTISVDGTGQASSVPDSAVVEMGVQNRAVTASVALSQTSVQVGALISALQESGIQQNDIQTLNVSLFPVYDQPQNPNDAPILTGFNATNIVRVRVRDLDSLGDLLDFAVGSGVNTIQNIQFELNDYTAAQDEARRDALDNARHKAEQLATLAGRELGEIRAMVESSSPSPVAFADSRGGVSAVPIAPGTQNVQVTVQVTWQLR